MKNKILNILAVAICICAIGLGLFALIYYNDHLILAGWWNYLIALFSTLSTSLLFAATAIFKGDSDSYFDESPCAPLAICLLVAGGGLIIAGILCTLLVSQLFWIMTDIGILAVITGFILLSPTKISAYILSVAVAIGACSTATCLTLLCYDGFSTLTWSGTVLYGNGWMYKYYSEESPEELRGGIALFAYNDRTAENIILPSEINGKTVLGVGQCSFRGVSLLKGVAIPDTVIEMYEDAFIYCTSLTSVHYGGSADEWCSIKFENERANPLYYAGNLYVGNERVIDLEISEATTEIGAFAFYNCKDIKTITLPATVTEIGESAFYGCEALTGIDFGGTKAQWNEIKKGENWNYLTDFYTIKCLDGELIK